MSISDSSGFRTAQDRLDRCVSRRGAESEGTVLDWLLSNPVEAYLTYPKDMWFTPASNPNTPPSYTVDLDVGTKWFTLSNYALGQMTSEVDIPAKFANTLSNGEDWERKELSDLLTERFKKKAFKQRGIGGTSFVNLAVRDVVRGFVSRSFNRTYRSAYIFEEFVRSCRESEAVLVSTAHDDLRNTLEYVLPHVFEVHAGHYMAFGVCCSNSDFGAGTYRVGPIVLNLSSSSTGMRKVATIFLKSMKAHYHTGTPVVDFTGKSSQLSDRNLRDGVVAMQDSLRSTVQRCLHPMYVDQMLSVIRKSAGELLSWSRLLHYAKGTLNNSDINSLKAILADAAVCNSIAHIDYDSDGNPRINRWWAANAVAIVAGESKNFNNDATAWDGVQQLSSAILSYGQ